MPITPRRREILDYISRFIDAHGHSPTLAEIGGRFGLKSPASVHRIISSLEAEGLIRRTPNVSRGVEVVRPPGNDEDNQCEIPLLGVVAAGHPIEAILNPETVNIPTDMLGRGRMFALRVRGDSMIGDHIRDSDLIIVESKQTANDGQTVVALIDGSEATVKRFYKDRGSIRLEPANPRFKPIIVKPPERVTVQGVVTAVIRKYDGKNET